MNDASRVGQTCLSSWGIGCHWTRAGPVVLAVSKPFEVNLRFWAGAALMRERCCTLIASVSVGPTMVAAWPPVFTVRKSQVL